MKFTLIIYDLNEKFILFRMYSMINTLREKSEDVRDSMNWNNYDHAIELITELLEVWFVSIRMLLGSAVWGLIKLNKIWSYRFQIVGWFGDWITLIFIMQKYAICSVILPDQHIALVNHHILSYFPLFFKLCN